MIKKGLIAAGIAVAFTAQLTLADTVDNAYHLCSVFDATGLLSQPCEVSGWNQAVDVSMDTNSTEARKICSGVSAMMAKEDILFGPDWKIRIYSPYSNENTIATCNLSN